LEEKRMGFVEPDAEPDEPAERGQADYIEQQRCDPFPIAAEPPYPPQLR
jgi:hypothetical protein